MAGLGVYVTRQQLDGQLTQMSRAIRQLEEVHESVIGWYAQQDRQVFVDMGYDDTAIDDLGGYINIMHGWLTALHAGGSISANDASLVTRLINAMFGPGGPVQNPPSMPPN